MSSEEEGENALNAQNHLVFSIVLNDLHLSKLLSDIYQYFKIHEHVTIPIPATPTMPELETPQPQLASVFLNFSSSSSNMH